MEQLNRHQRRALQAESRKAQASLSEADREEMHEATLQAARLKTRGAAVNAARAVMDTHQIRVGVIKEIIEDTLEREWTKAEREAWKLSLAAARKDRDAAVRRVLETLEDLASEQDAIAAEACSNLVVARRVVE